MTYFNRTSSWRIRPRWRRSPRYCRSTGMRASSSYYSNIVSQWRFRLSRIVCCIGASSRRTNSRLRRKRALAAVTIMDRRQQRGRHRNEVGSSDAPGGKQRRAHPMDQHNVPYWTRMDHNGPLLTIMNTLFHNGAWIVVQGSGFRD